MQVLPEDNYAVAGATTGHINSNDGLFGLEFPGLQDELAEFLQSHQVSGADPDALYVVWAGANDFFVTLTGGSSPADLISHGVANTAFTVQQLRNAGAQEILVLNVPDLGSTPFGLASQMSPEITRLAATYNQVLETTLQTLADWLSADGVASLRYDKLGSGQTGLGPYTGRPDSIGIVPFEQEAAAALRFLARQPGVDPARLGVIGHSEGALFALLLATGADPRGSGSGPLPSVHAVGLLEPLSERYLDVIADQVDAQAAAARQSGQLTLTRAASLEP